MYGRFKNNKVKSNEEDKQAKLERVNQMKKIYLQPRQGMMKAASNLFVYWFYIKKIVISLNVNNKYA